MDFFQLMVGVATVAMEAGAEVYKGKLAVACTLVNRMKRKKQSLSDICFAPWQFSAWNTDSPTRANLDMLPEATFAECLKAMTAALYALEPDPTGGAVFYLNKATVIKTAGQLPGWWGIDGDPDSEVVIDRHSFRRHR